EVSKYKKGTVLVRLLNKARHSRMFLAEKWCMEAPFTELRMQIQ
ncbi:MAG: hypothetical protein ACI9MF_001730, partial [Gammaproteobacteria bacterium]